MTDEDVMGVQERMIHPHLEMCCRKRPEHIETINAYRESQELEPISVDIPSPPFPRIDYCGSHSNGSGCWRRHSMGR